MDEPTQTPATSDLSVEHWSPDPEALKSLATTRGDIATAALDCDLWSTIAQTVNPFCERYNEAFDKLNKEASDLTTDRWAESRANLGTEYVKTIGTILTTERPGSVEFYKPAVLCGRYEYHSCIKGTLVWKAQKQSLPNATLVYVNVPEWDVQPPAPPSTGPETLESQDVDAGTSH